MKRVSALFILVLLFVVSIMFYRTSPAQAYSNTNLIDDVIFDNSNSMTATQIDSWLNSFPSSCISPNSGFSSSDPIGYSPNYPHVDGKYLYGSPVTAGRIVYDAAAGHGINPQVLLTKLQNEEQLVDGSAGCGSTWRYASAVGYACTDSDTFSHNYTYTGVDPYADSSALPTPIYYRNGVAVNSITGSCVNTNVFAGFSEQVVHAAWFLSSSRHKAEGQTGWAAISGNWNHCDDNNTCPASYNIPPSWACYSGYMTQGTFKRCPTDDQAVFYDGYAPIDGQSIHLDNGATAALYRYTPHFQSFDNIFTPWFGPTLTSAYNYSYVTATNPSINLQPGQSITNNSITIRNTGSATWYADGAVPAGQRPTRLAVRGYENIPFADSSDPNWLGTSNQIKMTPNTVAPGENATFTFNLAGPMRVYPFRYVYFVPVVDGLSFMRDVGMGFSMVNQPSSYAYVSQQSLPNPLLPNQSATASITIQNTGAVSWYADGAVPAGQRPTRLAVRGYENIPFADSSDPNWLGTSNQIKMTPNTVAPGENATFTFKAVGPSQSQGRSVFFVPVMDGVSFLADKNIGMGLITPQPSATYQYVSATNPPSTMAAGSTAAVTLTIKNTGNVVWQPESFSGPGKTRLRINMRRPSYHNSAFVDLSNGWVTASQISYNGPAVLPGQTATITFNWKAPAQTGHYVDYFAPVLDGYMELPDIGMGFAINVTP